MIKNNFVKKAILFFGLMYVVSPLQAHVFSPAEIASVTSDLLVKAPLSLRPKLNKTLSRGLLGIDLKDKKINFSDAEKQFIHQHILPKIQEMTWLTKINLSGLGLAKMPDGLEKLTNLVELDISHNRIKSIPYAFFSIPNLQILDFSHNRLEVLSNQIVNIAGLTVLNLKGNQLYEVPNALVNLNKLNYVDVSCNPLQRIGTKVMQKCTCITDLQATEVQECVDEYKHAHIRVFFELLGLNPHAHRDLFNDMMQGFIGVRHMNADPNSMLVEVKYAESVRQALARGISQICNLEWLTIIHLDTYGLRTLPPEFAQLKSLQQLSIKDDFFQGFPAVLPGLPKLQRLSIYSKRFYPESRIKSVGMYARMVDFMLARGMHINTLGDDGAMKRAWSTANFLKDASPLLREILFPQLMQGVLKYDGSRVIKDYLSTKLGALGSLTWLTEVHLPNMGIKQIPQMIFHMRALTHLDLSYNKIEEISNDIGNLSQLHTLRLSGNSLHALPAAVFAMEHLKICEISPAFLWEVGPCYLNFPPLKEQLKNYHVQDWQIDNHKKSCIVQFLGRPIERLPKNFINDLMEGRLGITLTRFGRDYVYLNLSDSLKSLIKSRLPYLGHLYWLVAANLDGLGLLEAPSSLYSLPDLDYLTLNKNELKILSPEFANLKKLRFVEFDGNQFQNFPLVLTEMPNLVQLSLQNNLISSLPPEISRMMRLDYINLGHNLLRALPDEIYGLNLSELLLNHNLLSAFTPGQGEFANLKRLGLAFNQFGVCPDMSSLTGLRELNLAGNYFSRVRGLDSIRQSLTKVDLALLHLAQTDRSANRTDYIQGEWQEVRNDPKAGLGIQSITRLLGSRVSFAPDAYLHDEDDDPNDYILPADEFISESEVYQRLENRLARWNRDRLAAAKMVEVPPQNVEPQVVLQKWVQLWTQKMNFDKPEQAIDYIDISLFDLDLLKVRAAERLATNKLRMDHVLYPILTGFIKTLFGVPLAEGETSGWQMKAAQIPAMRQYSSYVIHMLADHLPPADRVSIFIQFVNGIINCPIGQKAAIEAIVMNLANQNEGKHLENTENLETQLEHLLATEKENAFAEVMNQSENGQSVHIIGHYKTRLGPDLGLANLFEGIRDDNGIIGVDEFRGSLGNALMAFYDKFTPEFFAEKIASLIETKEDRDLKQNPRKTEDDRRRIREIEKERPLKVRDFVEYVNTHFTNDNDDEAENWAEFFTVDPYLDTNNEIQVKEDGILKIIDKIGLIHIDLDMIRFL